MRKTTLLIILFLSAFLFTSCDSIVDPSYTKENFKINNKKNAASEEDLSGNLVMKPGDEFIIKGASHGDGTRVTIDGVEVDVYTKESGEVAVIIPRDIGTKKVNISVIKNNEIRNLDGVFALDESKCPLMLAESDSICSDQIYCDVSGRKRFGTRNCVDLEALPDLRPDNIKEGVQIAGIKGSLVPAPAECSLDGEIGCVSTGAFPAAKEEGLAGKILAGNEVAGIKGAYLPDFPERTNVSSSDTVNGIAGLLPLCSEDGEKNCKTTSDFKAAKVSGAADKILNGQYLAGVLGNVILPSSAYVRAAAGPFGAGGSETGSLNDCSGNMEKGCVTTNSFVAAAPRGTFDLTQSFPGAGYYDRVTNSPKEFLLKSASLAGESGGIDSCAAGGSSCYLSAYQAGSQPLKAVDYDDIHANLLSFNIKSGVTILGVTGNYSGGYNSCTYSGEENCIANSSFIAAENKGPLDLRESFSEGYYTSLANAPSAGELKRGVQVNGVIGNFPSSQSPLPRYISNNGSNTAVHTGELEDLTYSNFVTSITTEGDFEYWDSQGRRYIGNGDGDISAANIKHGVEFANLNIVGSFGPNCSSDGDDNCYIDSISDYKALDTSAIDAWDIRRGKSAGGINGKIAIFQNGISSEHYNNVISPGLFGDDVYDTLDDRMASGGFPDHQFYPNQVPSAFSVDGDVVTDNITKLKWHYEGSSKATWQNARVTCDQLIEGGHSNWRLPTQKELMQAYIHRIYPFFKNENVSITGDSVWSATTSTNHLEEVYVVELDDGEMYDIDRVEHDGHDTEYRFFCVQD